MVVLNTRFYWERTLSISCHYVNKQSQDLSTTKTVFFELISFHTERKIRQKYWHSDLRYFSDPLTWWLLISVLKRGFLVIWVTPHFLVYNFRNKSALRLVFSSNDTKFYEDFGNGEKNWEIFFPFGDNCIWIGCFKHYLLLRDNTFHWVSIC